MLEEFGRQKEKSKSITVIPLRASRVCYSQINWLTIVSSAQVRIKSSIKKHVLPRLVRGRTVLKRGVAPSGKEKLTYDKKN